MATNGISRRHFVGAAAATAGGIAAVGAAATQVLAQSGATPPSPAASDGPIIIRNGHLMTMDDASGDIPRGDILIRNGVIEAVGEVAAGEVGTEIDASDCVVLPGFVDAHTHLWTTQLRGQFGDDKEHTYFPTRNRMAPAYTPEDMYEGTRLGIAEAVSAGITTMNDFCHNARSREHVDACVKAIAESGARIRFGYGAYPELKADKTIDLAHFEELAGKFKSGDVGLGSLALAWRGPSGATSGPQFEAAKAEYTAAKKVSAPIFVHASGKTASTQIISLALGQFLGPDVQVVHATLIPEGELKILIGAKSPVAITPITELRVGYGLTYVNDFMLAGLPLGIGIDSNSLAGAASMFEVMKLLQLVQNGRNQDELATQPRKLLQLATIDGARSLGLGNILGSLTVGKRADVIVVDTNALNLAVLPKDPAHLVVEAANPSNVRDVILEGKIKKQNYIMQGTAVKDIVAASRASLVGILQRAGQ